MICTTCQRQNVEEANFCKYCGSPYHHREEYITEAKHKVTRNEKQMKWAAVIGVLFGIVFILTELLTG